MTTATIKIGSRTLDCRQNLLVDGDREIPISPLAARFLEALAAQPGEIVTRDALIRDLWNDNALVGGPALSRVVSELRKAVGDSASRPTLVQTVPRQGYRLAPVGAAGEGPAEAWPNISWSKIAAIAALMVLGAALVSWMIGEATGLLWVARGGE